MSKSSLSSVVSNLVRAQMGSSVSNTVTDEDLDHYVAELILKEAKQKAERYGKDGIKAYLPSGYPESNVPKTNKRFLSSIIRSTDDHNKTILRAQALAAQEVRMERQEQERRERRARAEEAAEAERIRRLMGSSGRTDWAYNWDRDERRDRKRRERSWERGHGSADDEDEPERKRKSERGEREERRRRRSREGERRRRREDEKRSRRSRTLERYNSDDEYDRRRRERNRARDRSPTPTSKRDTSAERDAALVRRRRRSTERKDDERTSRSPSRHKHSRSRSPTVDRDSRSHRRKSKRARSSTSSDADPDRSYAKSPIQQEDGSTTLSREEALRQQLKSKGKAKAVNPPLSPSPDLRPSTSASRDPSIGLDSDDNRRTRPHANESKKTGSSSSRTLLSTPSPSPSPPSPPSSPPPLPPPPSKMDKYFETSYDPRLDVAPLTVPNVPSTGLINDEEFAGWDAMLEIIRLRREDKAEKKLLERWGVGKDKDKGKKKKGVEEPPSQYSEGGMDIMSIEYKKKGSVREWDLGKEGF